MEVPKTQSIIILLSLLLCSRLFLIFSIICSMNLLLKQKFESNEALVSNQKPQSFAGFQTAKGNSVKFSECSLKAVQKDLLMEQSDDIIACKLI